MKNVIVFGGQDYFSLMRGGCDGEFKPKDPYFRYKLVPAPINLIQSGKYHISLREEDGELDQMLNFIGTRYEDLCALRNQNHGNVIALEGEFKIVFNAHGEPILYRAEDKDPKRVTRICKTNSAFYKEYGYRFGHPTKTNPIEVRGWEFPKGTKHVLIRSFRMFELYNLVPELFGLELHPYIKKDFFEVNPNHTMQEWNAAQNRAYDRAKDWLYNHDPIDLSKSYEFTKEEWEILNKEKEEEIRKKREAAEELERRKNTEGYCHECGAEGATYIEYLGEWICEDCFNRRWNREDDW